MSLLDDIPGYREAVERESAMRAEAFTGAPEVVCGVELLPMTPRHLLLLEAIRSPFVCGGVAQPKDVALFLWCLSPQYAAALAFRRAVLPWSAWLAGFVFTRVQRRFFGRTRKLIRDQFIRVMNCCGEMVTDAMSDGPGGKDRAEWTPEYYSPVSCLVAVFAEKFGWSEDAILDCPFKRLWQYDRHLRDKPGTIFFNPSDRIRREWLRSQN